MLPLQGPAAQVPPLERESCWESKLAPSHTPHPHPSPLLKSRPCRYTAGTVKLTTGSKSTRRWWPKSQSCQHDVLTRRSHSLRCWQEKTTRVVRGTGEQTCWSETGEGENHCSPISPQAEPGRAENGKRGGEGPVCGPSASSDISLQWRDGTCKSLVRSKPWITGFILPQESLWSKMSFYWGVGAEFKQEGRWRRNDKGRRVGSRHTDV